MNVMVVGGAGFLGSHLVDRLLAEGHAVDVIDDLSTGSLGNLAEARAVGGEFKFHHLDAVAAELATVVQLRRPDVIVHLALLAPGEAVATGAGRALSSLLNVLEAARVHGTQKVVVALPAVAIYGDVSSRDLPVKEGHEWQPHSVVGVVARALAGLLGVYRDVHAVEHTALALTNVYGPRQRPADGVVAAFVDAAARGDVPTFHGDGRQTRDLLYVDDAVDALVRALDRGDGLVINIGTGVQTSIRDLWQVVAGPGAPKPALGPRRAGDVGRFAVSPVRARIHLAWAPWTDLATGVRSLAH